MSKKRKSRGGRPRNPRGKPLPTLGGDHGTDALNATQGTVIVPLEGPNNMGRRQRVCALDRLVANDRLTMPQIQAAQAIRNAYARTEQLSSGGPLKEWVQSSPKPDAAVAAQVDANSHWVYVSKPIRQTEKELVMHVVCFGLPIRSLGQKKSRLGLERLRIELDRVALHLGYLHPADARPIAIAPNMR